MKLAENSLTIHLTRDVYTSNSSQILEVSGNNLTLSAITGLGEKQILTIYNPETRNTSFTLPIKSDSDAQEFQLHQIKQIFFQYNRMTLKAQITITLENRDVKKIVGKSIEIGPLS